VAHEKVAAAMIRELPASQIRLFFKNFAPAKFGEDAGNVCGAGCGGGCHDATGVVFDRFGNSGVSAADLQAVKGDMAGFKVAVTQAITKHL